MKVIHLLRKPLSERTVASNTLKHGTGGLNIDASRIPSDGSHMVHGTVRRGDGTMMADRSGIGDGPGMFAPGSTFTPTTHVGGRWPANVILQHLDGCGEVCTTGCPIARLDADSLAGGMHSAGSNRLAKRGAGKTGMFPMDGDGHRFGDKGGASRFYKQVGGRKDA